MRAWYIILLMMLPLSVVFGAVDVQAKVVSPVGGSPIKIGVGEVSQDLKVVTEPGITLLGAERNGNVVLLRLLVSLPNPCYHIAEPIIEREKNRIDVLIPLIPPPEDRVCVQVVQERTVEVKFEAEEGTVVHVGTTRKLKPSPRPLPIVRKPTIRNEAGVKFSYEMDQDTILLKIEGCYKTEILPLKCPSCYEVYLDPGQDCPEETTLLKLETYHDYPPMIILRNRGAVEAPGMTERCKKALDILHRYKPEEAQRLAQICDKGQVGLALKEACSLLKDVKDKEALKVCVEAPGVPDDRCVKFVKELAEYAPDVAKEMEIRCREAGFFSVRERACEMLKERNQEAYRIICRPLIAKEIGREISSIVKEGNKTVEELRKEIERLRREIQRYRNELRELKLKMEELRRRIEITARGVQLGDSNQVLELPRLEVEARVKNRNVMVKKEENKIYVEVNGPVRVKAVVEAPVAVDVNSIEVGRRPLKVLPDEVLEKIKRKLKNVLPEEIKLRVEENKPVYQVKAKVKGRLLFIIPVEIPVETEVDAETGTVVRIRKPWWSIFAFGG